MQVPIMAKYSKNKPKCCCLNCKKEISINNLNKHYKSKCCKATKTNIDYPENLKCEHCLLQCKNKNSHRNHERTCPKNLNRVYKNGMKGKTAWNKGLDKTDPRVDNYAKTLSTSMKNLYESGYKSPVHTEKYWTEEKRKQKSEWKKQLHKENPNLHPNRLLAGNRKSMSYPEKIAYDFLLTNNVNFEPQFYINGYYVDFCINNNLIIEIDGEHWHPIGNQKDIKRDNDLTSLGYTVYRIRSKEHIEKRIKDILGD